MKDNENYVLVPKVKIGQFELETSIKKYKSKFEFSIVNTSFIGSEEIRHFELSLYGITLFVNKEDIIESIACDKKVLFNGKNLIGLSIEEFIDFTNWNYIGDIDELDFEDDNIHQFVYDFEEVGLQVWCKNDVIVTIIVS